MTDASVGVLQKAREAFLNAAPYLEERTWLEELLETLTQKATSIEEFEASVVEAMGKRTLPERRI